MRIRRHDYRRNADGWEGEHGEAELHPRGYGDILVTLNGIDADWDVYDARKHGS